MRFKYVNVETCYWHYDAHVLCEENEMNINDTMMLGEKRFGFVEFKYRNSDLLLL